MALHQSSRAFLVKSALIRRSAMLILKMSPSVSKESKLFKKSLVVHDESQKPARALPKKIYLLCHRAPESS
jgi:hypothetical protein